MARNDFSMEDLMDSVELKNRIMDGPVRLIRDSREIVFAPGQSVRLPRKIAEFLRHKSMFRFNPGDFNLGIQPKWEYKLAIMEDPDQDNSPLTMDYVRGVKELLDVTNMPELTRIDPSTGQPLRRVYIDPRSTGAMGTSDSVARQESQVVKKVSSAIVRDAADRIADAAQGTSEAEIVAAVADLTGAETR